MTTIVEALRELIAAWESLDGNRHYSSRKVEEWLADMMKPAIDNARAALTAHDAQPVAKPVIVEALRWYAALAEHDAQQKSTSVQVGCVECADPWKTPCWPGHCAAKDRTK